MSKIKEHIITTEHEDEDGNISITQVTETTNIQHINEPDYIKLYTKMWCEFNNIPQAYRQLFLALASRMTYCNTRTKNLGQLVYTGVPYRDAILEECGWDTRDALQKGLKALCKCNAIRKINRGVYQINPSYAGKGEWKYNPRLDRGGVEELVATFNFKKQTVQTDIIWSSTDKELIGKNLDSVIIRKTKNKQEEC